MAERARLTALAVSEYTACTTESPSDGPPCAGRFRMTLSDDGIHVAQALGKLVVAWVGYIVSQITLIHLLQVATLIFTVTQIYVLWRDKIFRRRPTR